MTNYAVRCRRAVLFKLLPLLSLFFVFSSVEAAVTLSVSVNPDPVAPAEVVKVAIVAANNGANTESGLSLEVVVPAEVNSFLATVARPSGAQCIPNVFSAGNCEATENVTWNVGNLLAGEAKVFQFQTTVAAAVADGTTINFATRILQNAVELTTTTGSATVQANKVLNLAVDADHDSAAAGEQLVYTLTYGNKSTGVASIGTILSMPVPAGTTFVSASGNGTYAAGTNSVSWSLVSLGAGESGKVQVTVQVDAALAAGSVIEATPLLSDNAGASAMASRINRIQSATPLNLVISPNIEPARQSEFNTLNFTVNNPSSNNDRFGVVLEVLWPAQASSFLATRARPAVSCVPNVFSAANCEAGEWVTFNLGDIAAGASVSMTLPNFVAAATPNGRVISYETRLTDGAGLLMTEGLSINVQSNTVLNLRVDADADPVANDDLLTYTLTYGNRTGGVPSVGTTIDIPIPAGTAFVAASDNGTYDNATNHVSWSLNSLGAGKSGKVTLQVQVDAAAALPLGSVIEATPSISDNAGEIAIANRVTRVAATSPLNLSIAPSLEPLRQGEFSTLNFTVSNPTGNGDRFAVALEVLWPADAASFLGTRVRPASVTCVPNLFSAANCEAGEWVTLDLGNILAGESVTVTLPITVAAATLDGFTIPFETRLTDGAGLLMTKGRSINVQSDTVLNLRVDADADPVANDDLLTYTLTYGNRSAGVASVGSTLSMPIPAGTTFVSASDSGVYDDVAKNVTWSLTSLSPGKSGKVQLQLRVNAAADLVQGSVIEATPTIVDNAGNIALSSRITRVRNGTPLNLEIQPAVDPARQSETSTMNFTVNNPTTGDDRFAVVLEVLWPANIASFLGTQVRPANVTCVPNLFSAGNCEAGEWVTLSLGDIPAGESITVTLPSTVAAAAPDGLTIPIETRLTDGGGVFMTEGYGITVQSDRKLKVRVDADANPVSPGDTLTLNMTFGNLDTTSSLGTSIEMPLPQGTSFISANGNGSYDLASNLISWNIGAMPASQGGKVRVQLQVDSALAGGQVIVANPVIRNSAGGIDRVRKAIEVKNNQPVSLAINVNPGALLPAGTGSVTYQVTSNVDSFAVVLEALMPGGINAFAATAVTDATVSCVPNLFSAANCETNEWITVNVGDLTAGQTTTVTIPVTVAATAGQGYVIPFRAYLRDGANAQIIAESSLIVGNQIPTPGGNRAPVAVNDSYTTTENTAFTTGNVLNNDSDPDGDTLTVQSIDTTATQGTVQNNGDGTFGYTPPANFTGSDTFGYTISDGNGGSSSATVTITINAAGPLNQDPTAVNDSFSTNMDVAFTTGNVLSNDSDPDGDSLTIQSIDTTATQGTVQNNNDGTFTYTPASGFTGDDSFTYTVSDGRGGSASATVTITVKAPPQNPGTDSGGGGGSFGFLEMFVLLLLVLRLRKSAVCLLRVSLPAAVLRC